MVFQEHYSNPSTRSRGYHPATGFASAYVYRVAGSLLPLHIIAPLSLLPAYCQYDLLHFDRTPFPTCSQTGNPEKWPDRDGVSPPITAGLFLA